MQGETGVKLRTLISNNNALMQLIDFGTNQIFESATTYTCILFLSKERKDNFTYKKYELGDNIRNLSTCEKLTLDENRIKDKCVWNFSNDEFSRILSKIKMCGVNFETITTRIFKGSSTGNDKIFLLDLIEDKGDSLYVKSEYSDDPFEVETDICRHFIYGENVLRFSIPNQPKDSYSHISKKVLITS